MRKTAGKNGQRPSSQNTKQETVSPLMNTNSGIDKHTAKDIWQKLFLTADILRNTICQMIESDLHVNYAQLPLILFFLVYRDAGPAMKDLLEITGLSSGAASQAVDSMVEAGLLKRTRSEQDLRSFSVRATDKLLSVRTKLVRFLEPAQDAFRRNGGFTPEELSAVHEVFVRLAGSRTGGEYAAAKRSSDLAVPGLISNAFADRKQLEPLPDWGLILLFAVNLRSSMLIYYYGKHVRMTLGKLRVMYRLFFLSCRKEADPSLKDLSTRFRTTSSLMSQTLNALISDGMLERVVLPSDPASVFRVRLSRQGLRIRRQTAASCTEFMRNFFAETEPEKINLFTRVMDRMMRFLLTDGKEFLLPGEPPDMFL